MVMNEPRSAPYSFQTDDGREFSKWNKLGFTKFRIGSRVVDSGGVKRMIVLDGASGSDATFERNDAV